VADNEHCLISDNPDEFAKRCIGLLNDYLTANRLIQAGYALAKKHFDARNNSSRIKNLFENAKS
jgi:glycosyltransferase involved in cell wall biosynthesis